MAPKGQRFEGIGMLRGVAALLVVYAHLYGQQMTREGASSSIVTGIQRYITTPLNIIEDFGWFGVCLFFLISGFVITHSIQNESVRSFCVRRIMRIYPALWFCLGLTTIARGLEGVSLPSWWSVFQSATLLGVPPNVPSVIGVEWTLYVELKFYIITALLCVVLRSSPILSYAIQALIILILLRYMRYFDGNIFLASLSGYMLVYLLFGQIIYFVYQKAMSISTGCALGAINYIICIYGEYEIDPSTDFSHKAQIVSLFYCLVLFCFALYRKDIRIPKLLKFFEKISYSLYLLHAALGIATMHLISGWVRSFDVRFIIAFGTATLAAWISFRLIEAPSIAVGKKLTKSKSIVNSLVYVPAE